jgi:hypothetical protein
MQNHVLKSGLVIFCNANDPSGSSICARDTGSNNMSLSPGSFAGSSQGCPSMAATILHEMVHGLAQDSGAPDAFYHDFGPSIDCRDRPYGCEESCFPGSTGGGNGFACIETPAFMTQSIQAGNGEGVACNACKPVTYVDNQGVSHTSTACSTILPTP